MCGICGFYQFEREAKQDTLKLMNDQIIHRGPDDEGYYLKNGVGLAARRLSIIDLVTGHQPLASASGKNWITYNGEVYNFKCLREELQTLGYKFRTETDTEVIVNLYEEFGLDFVTKLRGMFAIGIYDVQNERLVLARDHVGIKPLYYYQKPENKNLIFGSEIKSLLKYPGIKKNINFQALDYFLTLEYIPAPHSIFAGIQKLAAGHILIYERGKIKIEQYWDVNKAEISQNPHELKEHFLDLLRESVKMRMISDVPLGAFLSGGIDSSSIVAMMSQLSADPIKTFSIGFDDQSYSELPYSNQIAKQFSTDHYTKTLSPNISELVLYLSDFLDEPLGDFSNFPTYLVSKTARERVTVVLSGDGGDEIFGGYEHYIAQKMARLIDPLIFRPLHSLFAKITTLFPPSKLKKGFINRIKRFSEGLNNSVQNRHFRWMLFLSDIQKAYLYSSHFLDIDFSNYLPERFPFSSHFKKAGQDFSGITRDLYLDFKTYLADDILVKVDRMSMANSLEARVPLLDTKIVEFAFSLPSKLKVKGLTGKWFLKNAMEGILPKEIIYRRKEGFSIPIKNWLKLDLKDLMMEYLSEARIKDVGVFNYTYITRLIDEHLSNKENHAHRLWGLISFNLWKERFFN